MSEYKHRRDDEDDSFEHTRQNDMPSWLRWSVTAIKDVGFPAVMCLLVWWKSETSDKKLVESLNNQAATLQVFMATINGYHAESNEWKARMFEELRQQRNRP